MTALTTAAIPTPVAKEAFRRAEPLWNWDGKQEVGEVNISSAQVYYFKAYCILAMSVGQGGLIAHISRLSCF